MAAVLLAGLPALAQAPATDGPALSLPIRCTIGQDCWIGAHYDRDRGTGRSDFACGLLTYQDHNGTDFMVRDRARVAEGVDVVAAAAGRVRNVRDGMEDVDVTIAGTKSVAGRECGNAVAIQHGNGWETQYCHMRKGSIAVKPGDEVTAGTVLGKVGMSGLTSYPHVHLSVRKEGKDFDPFSGHPLGRSCAPGPAEPPRSLWTPAAEKALAYGAGSIFNYGVSGEQVTQEKVREGRYRATSLARTVPVLGAWMEIQGGGKDDTYRLTIKDPQGRVLVSDERTVPEAKLVQYRFVGRKAPQGGFAPGRYTAEFEWTRVADKHTDRKTLGFEIAG